MRVIDANAFIELVPWRSQLPDVFQIFVTTRDRQAMPLLRYHTGDLVRRTAAGYRLLGRERDLHFRADGSLVTPFEVDAALPDGFMCWHYCLAQTSDQRWDFQYVADHTAPPEVETALAGVLGNEVRVNAFRRRFIQPSASGKFALLKPLAK
jgi:phenylacetate-CoA ligase